MVCSIIIISACPSGIVNSTSRKEAIAFHQYFFVFIRFEYVLISSVPAASYLKRYTGPEVGAVRERTVQIIIFRFVIQKVVY